VIDRKELSRTIAESGLIDVCDEIGDADERHDEAIDLPNKSFFGMRVNVVGDGVDIGEDTKCDIFVGGIRLLQHLGSHEPIARGRFYVHSSRLVISRHVG
jgi:hypothetical protein